MADCRIWTVLCLAIRPDRSLKKISENAGQYFAISVAIFVIAYVGTAFVMAPYGMVESAEIAVISVVHGLFTVAFIVWITNRYGAGNGFKKMFTVLSCCLFFPIMAGLGLDITEQAYTAYHDMAHDGSPSFGFDLGIVGSLIWRNLAAIVVAVWLIILHTKAVMVTCKFGGRKSLAIIIVSILAYYPVSMAIGILTVALREITM